MNVETHQLFDNQYFPCINWFKTSINETNINIIAYGSYKKRSFYNRCAIASAAGVSFLSIPLAGGRNSNQKKLFRDVKIDYSFDWQKQHWRSLKTSYNNSPFFEHYAECFLPYFEKKFDFLFDFNLDILQTIIALLFTDNKRVILVDKYLDDRLSRDDNKPVAFYPADYAYCEPTPKYYQLFEDKTGFLPNMSILDLLFMEGNNSVNVLKSV